MIDGGGQHGRARGARTVTITLNVLQQALSDAAQQGLIVRNVACLVQRPRQPHQEMTTWTLAEVRQFQLVAADERLKVAWLLTLLGLRRGEVLGLRWQDVTLDEGRPEIRIRQTRVPVHGQGVVISEPKTSRGRRSLPLDPYLVTAFRDFRDLRDREAAILGQVVGPTDIVVTDELGVPIPPDKHSKMFRTLSTKARLRTIRLHDVRHTALTLMALKGVPLAVVAAWAGHADPAFTLRVYAH
jgi:integrase